MYLVARLGKGGGWVPKGLRYNGEFTKIVAKKSSLGLSY